jgi:hypothetical protein
VRSADACGPDVGHECVRLKNNGSQAENLDGWKLWDEANNMLTLSGSIRADAEGTNMLVKGEQPLNNCGYEIGLPGRDPDRYGFALRSAHLGKFAVPSRAPVRIIQVRKS